jgi:hypothetical protein
MALIDVSAEIKGSSEAVANSGLRMSVTAQLRGFAASGLGKQPAQSQSEQKPEKTGA